MWIRYSLQLQEIGEGFMFLKNDGKDVLILFTNGDKTFPIYGMVFPGTGALYTSLISSLNHQPDAILGKPNKSMLDTIISKYELEPAKVVMIGDNLETDIAFRINGGIDTCAVRTGVSSEEILAGKNGISPTFYLEFVGK